MPTSLSRPRPLVRAALRALPLPVLIALVAFAATFAFPQAAHADTYALPSVHIQAQVMENGDLFVTEARTFAFEDTVNGVYWDIPFADNEQGSASAVSVLDVRELDDAPEDEADARRASQPMQEVSSANSGRAAQPMREVPSANAGDSDAYTVESQGDSLRLKVFLPREDGDETTVWVSYMIEGAIMAWPDTAELYWQFIGSEWEEDAENVHLDVTFAGAAQGTPAATGASGANLRAWGHGPLDGEVSLNTAEPGDPHVTLEAPVVRAGQFAEVRATFPIDWVPGLAPSGESRLESVLSEEAAWAEEANAQREGARQVAFTGTAVLTVAPAIMLGVVVYLRKTRYASPKPVFDETYFRDLPSNDHPAVLSALVYSGAVQDCAFVATLMKLTDDRVIKIKHETRTEDRFLGLGEKKVEEYWIELVARECITDPIDLAAIDLTRRAPRTGSSAWARRRSRSTGSSLWRASASPILSTWLRSICTSGPVPRTATRCGSALSKTRRAWASTCSPSRTRFWRNSSAVISPALFKTRRARASTCSPSRTRFWRSSSAAISPTSLPIPSGMPRQPLPPSSCSGA